MKSTTDATKDFYCEICCLQFDKKFVFDMHERLVHGITQSEVEIKEEPLEEPPKSHEEDKTETFTQLLQRSHQCPNCTSIFSRKDNLMSHIASVHEKKKPHQCTDCDQTYAKKDNLKVHMAAIHEGLRLNKCPHCGTSFAQKTQMLTHISSVHEGKKPFSCSKCDSKFSRKAHLERHTETAHDDKEAIMKKDVMNFLLNKSAEKIQNQQTDMNINVIAGKNFLWV